MLSSVAGSLWGIVEESGVSENPKLRSLFWEPGLVEREQAKLERAFMVPKIKVANGCFGKGTFDFIVQMWTDCERKPD